MFRFNSTQPDTEATILAPERSKSNGAKIEKRQITRNRTSYSCLTCRRRKVKCDKIHPVCGGCKRAGEHCLYSQDDASATSVQSDTWKNDDSFASKKRKTSVPGQHSSGLQSTSVASGTSVTSPQLKVIEEHLHHLTSMIDALRGNDGRLRDLLTPVPSISDHESDERPSRPSMSLDMFQSTGQGSVKDTTELSQPLSALKLGTSDTRVEDPFWNHISDEIDQLNTLMRRQSNTFVSSTSPQNHLCDTAREPLRSLEEERPLERDDFWDPTSFHKEAGLDVVDKYDPDSSCPVCRMMLFTKSSLLQDVPVRCSRTTAIQHLTKGLPTRAQSNVLLRSWLSGVYPILGLVIPSDFLRKHEEFWAQHDGKVIQETQYPDVEFFALLHAVWYAGSLSISTKGLQHWFPNTSRAKISSRFHDQVVFCLHLGSFTRNPSLHKLAAFILVHSMPVAEEDPIQGSLYMQLVVRLGVTAGLHREPSLFDLSVAEAGMRRRLWWQIIQLDISLAVASGSPSQISEAFSDTRINSEDRDALPSSDDTDSATSDKKPKNSSPNNASTNAETPNPNSYRTLPLVARGKSVIACALRSVISIHLGTKMLTNADMLEMKRVMSEAGDQINAILKLIPAKGLPELGFVPNAPKEGQQRYLDCDPLMGTPVTEQELVCLKTSLSESDASTPMARYYRQRQSAYNKWARITLSMLIDKLSCVAYAPFLKNTKSKLWSVGRQCALHNCHSFLRKFISLATDTDLEPFRWGWPASYGPMHASLIILVDLYERPHSVEAPRSRELVDEMFSLGAPESGIVGGPNGVSVQRPLREGGIEVWDMLRGLRSAAWQKAGLDPKVLWTEADQVEIGLAAPLTDAQKIARSLREDSIYEEDDRTQSNGITSVKSSKPGRRSTDHDVRFLANLAQNELADPEEREGYPCSRARRNQFLQDIENEARLNLNQGLARREGQQMMPFPVSGRLEKCTGRAAMGALPSHGVLAINDHIPRPSSEAQTCQDQSHVATPKAPANQGGNGQELSDMPPAFAQSQGIWEQSSINGAIALQQASTSNQASEQKANIELYVNGFANGSSDNFHSHSNEESRGQNSVDSVLRHEGPPSTNMDLGFDWERWDAVFGQYSGFTDLMEDVAWDAYGES